MKLYESHSDLILLTVSGRLYYQKVFVILLVSFGLYYKNSTIVLQINIIPLPVTMNRQNKKNTSQIEFSSVTRKQQIKLVLRRFKSEFNVLIQMLQLHSFIYNISCLVK